jgi:hypothetical protein
MAFGRITLTPAPAAEAAAQIGDGDYAGVAFLQGRRYIALLRAALGVEPDGARLRVRRPGVELEPYVDVVVEYDDRNAAAFAYALRCERDAPTRWRESNPAAGAGTTPPGANR